MNPNITVPETFRRPSAFLPIIMSMCAIAVVVVHLVYFGPLPQPDEGPTAHVWQLLMGVQFPIVAFFVIRWVPRVPRAALLVVAAQIGAAITALAPVYLLKW